ncbi:MAG TPA: DUF507 family protein [Vulgatibacter sp.]|nr:DUF507 family protein [Vulgatibacter sp.]
MRLYPKVIPVIAREVVQTLMKENDIEVETLRINDAEMDMSAIMREYLASEERVNQATKEALERRGYDHSKFNQVKREMADVRGFKMGDEGIEYVIGQMIEFLLISRNVEEVYSEDATLRRKIYAIFKKHLDLDAELDREARARMKNLTEGTAEWEVEYNRTMDQLKRARGLI